MDLEPFELLAHTGLPMALEGPSLDSLPPTAAPCTTLPCGAPCAAICGAPCAAVQKAMHQQLQQLQYFVARWSEEQHQLLATLQAHCEPRQGDIVPPTAYDLAEVTNQEHVAFAVPSPRICASKQSLASSRPAPEALFRSQGSASALPRKTSRRALTNSAAVAEAPKAAAEELGHSKSQTSPPSRGTVQDIATNLRFHRIKTHGVTARRPAANGCMARMVSSKHFTNVTSLVILANAVTMGVSTDYQTGHLTDPPPKAIQLLEAAFTCFYVLEVALRAIAQRFDFCKGREWRWNLFDLVIVLCAVVEQIQDLILRSSPSTRGNKFIKNVSFLRVMRLMKMVRLLRVIRLLHAFRELRLILNSILGCLKTSLWALILIIAIAYMFSLFFVQMSTNFLLDNMDNPEGLDDTLAGIDMYWRGIGKSMLSLYMSSTQGHEWASISEPLMVISPIVYCVFLLYIGFFLFVVVNALTSMFVESTLLQAEADEQQVIQSALDQKDHYIHKLQALFDEIDTDGSGEISYEEFRKVCNSPELHGFAASLEIDISDADLFFYTLSNRGQREVDIETFVVACIQMRGPAKSVDLMDLIVKNEDFVSDCTARLGKLEQLLGALPRNHAVPTLSAPMNKLAQGAVANAHLQAPPLQAPLPEQTSSNPTSAAKGVPRVVAM